MANETDFLDQLLNSIEITRNYVLKLDRAIKNKLVELNKLVAATENLESPGYITAQLEKVINIFKKNRVKSLTKGAIRDAASENTEFQYPALLQPLLSCAEDPNIVTMILGGTGWSTVLLATPNFEEVAGNINDWSEAIARVRESNEWNSGPNPDPNFASMIWKKLIYRGEDYSRTIDERISAAGSPAPYWEILNYGVVGMSSDWGGYPYPVNKPTLFVENIKSALEEEFILNRDDLREKTNQKINEGSIVIEELKKKLIYAKNLLEEIKKELDNPDITRRVAEKLGVLVEQIEGMKVSDLINKLKLGVDLYSTIELTAPGQGKVKRIRVREKKLRDILNEIIAELEAS